MNENIKMKRTVDFRDADMNSWSVTIELRNRKCQNVHMETLEEYESLYELSICGSGGFSSGQCDSHINARTEGQKRLLEMWDNHHLNGLSAGTKLQNDYLSGEYKSDYEKFINTFSTYSVEFRKKMNDHLSDIFVKQFDIDILAALRMEDVVERNMKSNPFDYILGTGKDLWNKGHGYDDLYVKYFFLAMKGLLVDRGYKYGSGWLSMPLPANIVEQINEICNLIEQEEEELTNELNPVFDMGAEGFEATQEIVNKVMELRECDEDEAQRFLALGMFLGCTFGDLNDTFDEENGKQCLYRANGIEYYIGTEEELTEVADAYLHDSDYEYIWKDAVAADQTTKGLEDWLEEVLENDGWCSILNHWDGESYSYCIAGKYIEVSRS